MPGSQPDALAAARQFARWVINAHYPRSYRLYSAALAPWLDSEDGRSVAGWLATFASRTGDPIPPAETGDLMALYALSRVNDILITSYQTVDPDSGAVKFDGLGAYEYERFWSGLGLRLVRDAPYSPVLHEIVGVEQTQPADPIVTVEEAWPALMLGPMVFSRGGAHVMAGEVNVVRDVWRTSTLYWA